MNIYKEQFVDLSLHKERGIPYIHHFTIEEFRSQTDESCSTLITLKKSEIDSEIHAFILLLERLEYHEEEWEWNEKLVVASRDTVLHKIFTYMREKGDFARIDFQTASKKINEFDIDIDVNKELTEDSHNVIIFDGWNLLQVAGSNADHYYLFTWYTTA